MGRRPIVPLAPPRRKRRSERRAEAKARDARLAPPAAPPTAPPAALPPPTPLARLTFSGAPADGRAIAASPDRADKSERFLRWLLAPLEPAEFMAEFYERRPLYVRREARGYNDGWFSTAELERQLAECELRWTEEVDVAVYANGERRTLNGDGVATAAAVKALFDEGGSVRLSWPQRHSDEVWAMLVMLEAYFGAGAGANVYATPAGCQGFAPHWDDINAFVLQLEGEKRWRIYGARSEEETLPRYSSPNFTQEELGPLVADVTLSPGDLLYLPRGVVHQAVSGESHSLHITLSVGRQHSWRDLLEMGLTGAIEAAALERPAWRQSLPCDFGAHMGVMHAEDEAEAEGEGEEGEGSRRAQLKERLRGMLKELVETMPLDAMCDQFLCQRYMYDRLPPKLSPADSKWRDVRPEDVCLDSRLRLVSQNAARLAVEDGFVALYFCTHNTRVYHEVPEPQHIDFAMEAAPALEMVLQAYPKYVSVARLPADNDAMRLDIARAMVEARVVLVRPPKEEAAVAVPKPASSIAAMAQRASSGKLAVPRKRS